jgi:hypothetical protein
LNGRQFDLLAADSRVGVVFLRLIAALKKFVFDTMDYEGEFDAADGKRNAQARLEERVAEFLNHALSESTVREYVREYANGWCEHRAAVKAEK